jgi:outer membrane protein assembly factor BamB
LDGTTGKRLWSHNIITENDATQIEWGSSGSPLVFDDMVVVSAGGPEGKSLVAYHKDTGERLWHGGSDQASYASPVLANLAGQRQIVSVNEDWVVGYDIANGQPLWRYSWPGSSSNNANVSQPVPVGPNRLFLSKGYAHGCAVIELSRDASGKFEVREIARESTTMKTKLTNVVVHENHVYGLSGGILECVDLDTLRRQWKGGRYGHGQVMLVDELILVVSERGAVALVEATPANYRELTRFQAIDGKTWNNPALSGPYLLVRNHLEAACYELPTASSALAE